MKPEKRLGKAQIAELYGVSIKTFMRDIAFLVPRLEPLGYRKNKRSFSAEMVRIIAAEIGEP